MPRRVRRGLTLSGTPAYNSAAAPKFANSAAPCQDKAPPQYLGYTEPPLLLPSPSGSGEHWVSFRPEPSLHLATGQTEWEGQGGTGRIQQPCVRYPDTLNLVQGSFFSLLKPLLLWPWRPHPIPSAQKMLPSCGQGPSCGYLASPLSLCPLYPRQSLAQNRCSVLHEYSWREWMNEWTDEGGTKPSFAIPADSHVTLALLPQEMVPLGELKTFRSSVRWWRERGSGNSALGSSFLGHSHPAIMCKLGQQCCEE